MEYSALGYFIRLLSDGLDEAAKSDNDKEILTWAKKIVKNSSNPGAHVVISEGGWNFATVSKKNNRIVTKKHR